tara:strand:- start:729 stop:980 length:252 start_codon:yes stop_codon:yes gene_type:complete
MNPAQILEETKFVVLEEDYNYGHIVEFFNDEDVKILDILVTTKQVETIMTYIIDFHDEISVYHPNLSHIVIPSKQQLYEEIYS